MFSSGESWHQELSSFEKEEIKDGTFPTTLELSSTPDENICETTPQTEGGNFFSLPEENTNPDGEVCFKEKKVDCEIAATALTGKTSQNSTQDESTVLVKDSSSDPEDKN